MRLYVKATMLKSTGRTKIYLAVVDFCDMSFTDELAEQLLRDIQRKIIATEKPVSCHVEWISSAEAAEIIRRSKNN